MRAALVTEHSSHCSLRSKWVLITNEPVDKNLETVLWLGTALWGPKLK